MGMGRRGGGGQSVGAGRARDLILGRQCTQH